MPKLIKSNEVCYLAHPLAEYTDDFGREYKRIDNRICEALYAMHIKKEYGCILRRPLKEISVDLDEETAMAKCLEMLAQCGTLILCGNWEKSKGCRLEEQKASHLGIKIIQINDRLQIKLLKTANKKAKLGEAG